MQWLLLAPSIFVCLMFVAWPVGELLVLSVQKTDFLTSRFVGLQNYITIWSDAGFVRSIWNSVWYSVLCILFTAGGSLAVALLVMREGKRWHDTVRILLYLPFISAGVIIAQVWRWVFHIGGPINQALALVGVAPVHWFGQGLTAIPVISLIVGATTIGGTLVVTLSAILGVDKALYDAAQIDGASWWQIKTRIVVPSIARTLWVIVIVSAIAGPQIWETIYALAPFDHSATMAWQIYVEAFQMGRHGTAAAQSVVMAMLLIGMALVKNKVEKAGD